MNKDVIFTLRSVQWIDNESAETELITAAIYEDNEGGGYKITYDENLGDGFEGIKTVITCYNDKLCTLNRTGTAISNLIIEKDRTNYCRYGTPYGELTMGVYAHKISYNLDDNGGDMYMKYSIDVNSRNVTENEIYLNIK